MARRVLKPKFKPLPRPCLGHGCDNESLPGKSHCKGCEIRLIKTEPATSLLYEHHVFTTETCVYFIQESSELGAIKIGQSLDVVSRINCLQIATPHTLRLLHFIETSGKVEHMLHNYFARFNIHGEWFHPDKEILDFIEDSKDGRHPPLIDAVLREFRREIFLETA